MSLFKKIKHCLGICDHEWVTRYDERYDLGDGKHHTFYVAICNKCGKVKILKHMQ